MENFASSKDFNKTSDFVQNAYTIELANNVTLADVLRPDYWKSVAGKLNKLDIITVIGGKDGLDHDLRVMSTGLGFACVRVIRAAPMAEQYLQPIAGGEARVEFRPNRGWVYIDGNGAVVSEGHSTREEALAAA